MNWCRVCGRYHLYGACTVTEYDEDRAWRKFRELLRLLTKGQS